MHGTMSLQIDPHFKAHIPALRDDERATLEESLLREGCREPLIVWAGENVLLDGHNRYELCQKHGLSFDTLHIDLPDRDAAFAWIEDNQLGRRNLTPDQFRYYLGRKYQRERGQHGGARNSSPQNEDLSTGKAAERVAKQHGVGRATVERAGDYASNLDKAAEVAGEGFKQKVLSGQEKATSGDIQEYAEVAREEGGGLQFSDENEAEEWLKKRRREKQAANDR